MATLNLARPMVNPSAAPAVLADRNNDGWYTPVLPAFAAKPVESVAPALDPWPSPATREMWARWEAEDAARVGIDPRELPTAEEAAAWAEQTREFMDAGELAVFSGVDLGTPEFREDDGPDDAEIDAMYADCPEYDADADSPGSCGFHNSDASGAFLGTAA